ncbi:MAG: hypothetical protein HYZ65_08180 [Burkholderiales bacterium]|nr:hypothetical protein [Burkholderiales bacterium]
MSGKVLLVLTNAFLDNSHSINHLRRSLPFLCKIQVKSNKRHVQGNRMKLNLLKSKIVWSTKFTKKDESQDQLFESRCSSFLFVRAFRDFRGHFLFMRLPCGMCHVDRRPQKNGAMFVSRRFFIPTPRPGA